MLVRIGYNFEEESVVQIYSIEYDSVKKDKVRVQQCDSSISRTMFWLPYIKYNNPMIADIQYRYILHTNFFD